MSSRWTTVGLIIIAIFILGASYYRSQPFSGLEPSLAPVPTVSTTPASDAWQLEMELLESPLPVVFGDSLEEARVQEQMKEGAVVLPLGWLFGDAGNVVVAAHSSGTSSFGPYRFAFTKLTEIKEGDVFTLKGPDGIFQYRVYEKEIVWPHEVDKLPNDDRSTVTLVTCWPVWTDRQRLLVHGELVQQD